MRPDLAARRPVNAEARNRPIPLAEKRIVGVEAIEAAPLQRIRFDIAAAPLLFPIFLRVARLRWERCKAPVRREREVDVVAVGIEEARAHDGGFEIVMAHDRRDAADIAKRALVQAEKCLELLIPDGFLIAVTGVAKRHPKHPRPSPFPRRHVQRRGAAEEINLRFRAGRAMKHADGSSRRRDRPHEPLHRFVARAVADGPFW
jgi:hypothetical protein